MKKSYSLVAILAMVLLSCASIQSVQYGPHGEDPDKWAEFCDCSEDYGDAGVEACYYEIFGIWVDAYSTYTDSLVILDHKPTHEIPY